MMDYPNAVRSEPTDGAFFMSRINYTCIDGYVLKSRRNVTTHMCHHSGKWTGNEVICECK